MGREQEPNVELLRHISFRDAIVDQNIALSRLTDVTRRCVKENINTLRKATEGLKNPHIENLIVSAENDSNNCQRGLVLDAPRIEAFYAQFNGGSFKNMMTTSVSRLKRSLATSPMEPHTKYMNFFSDVMHLITPPFTFNGGVQILTETLRQEEVDPYDVGQMADHTYNMQLPVSISSSVYFNPYFDGVGTDQFKKIYMASLNPPERMRFLSGLNTAAAWRDITRYATTSN